MNAQDVTILLLWIAIATILERRQRPFAAGLISSLCATKFHLFLLVPVMLLSQKQWRSLAGLAAGGAGLMALSFAVAGHSWPLQYYSALRDPSIHPDIAHMPNLRGLFVPWPSAQVPQWMLVASIAASIWVIARRTSFENALAATLAGSILLSYHSYVSDCALLLPAALIVISTTAARWLRLAAFILLLPPTYLCLLFEPPVTLVVPIAILAFLLLMLIEAWQRPLQA